MAKSKKHKSSRQFLIWRWLLTALAVTTGIVFVLAVVYALARSKNQAHHGLLYKPNGQRPLTRNLLTLPATQPQQHARLASKKSASTARALTTGAQPPIFSAQHLSEPQLSDLVKADKLSAIMDYFYATDAVTGFNYLLKLYDQVPLRAPTVYNFFHGGLLDVDALIQADIETLLVENYFACDTHTLNPNFDARIMVRLLANANPQTEAALLDRITLRPSVIPSLLRQIEYTEDAQAIRLYRHLTPLIKKPKLLLRTQQALANRLIQQGQLASARIAYQTALNAQKKCLNIGQSTRLTDRTYKELTNLASDPKAKVLFESAMAHKNQGLASASTDTASARFHFNQCINTLAQIDHRLHGEIFYEQILNGYFGLIDASADQPDEVRRLGFYKSGYQVRQAMHVFGENSEHYLRRAIAKCNIPPQRKNLVKQLARKSPQACLRYTIALIQEGQLQKAESVITKICAHHETDHQHDDLIHFLYASLADAYAHQSHKKMTQRMRRLAEHYGGDDLHSEEASSMGLLGMG